MGFPCKIFPPCWVKWREKYFFLSATVNKWKEGIWNERIWSSQKHCNCKAGSWILRDQGNEKRDGMLYVSQSQTPQYETGPEISESVMRYSVHRTEKNTKTRWKQSRWSRIKGNWNASVFLFLGNTGSGFSFGKKLYAPKRPDEEWASRFCEALDRLTRVEYLMDILLYSPLEERVEMLPSAGKEIAGYAGRDFLIHP